MKEQISVIANNELINTTEWSDFVLTHENGTIFQSPEMYDIYNQTPLFSPFVFAAYKNNKIVGVLVGAIQSEHKGILALFTARSIVFGGPLTTVDDSIEITTKLLSEYDKTHKKDVIYTQFRNLFDISHYSTLFHAQNYTYDEHLDFHIDLRKDKELLWSNLASQCRGKIRKAEKATLQIKTLINAEEKLLSYTILKDVYDRANLPLASKELFENSIKILDSKNMLEYIGVFYETKLIGIRIVLKYKDIAYDWYGGSLGEYYKYCPNEILVWEVLLKMKADNFTLYDFGGAGHPNKPYGVREFKKKFGGQLVNFGRYEKTHKPLLMQIGKMGFWAFKLVKKIRNK